jgi:hypothetical protein
MGDPLLILVHNLEIVRDLRSGAGRRCLAIGHQASLDIAEFRDLAAEGVEIFLAFLTQNQCLNIG